MAEEQKEVDGSTEAPAKAEEKVVEEAAPAAAEAKTEEAAEQPAEAAQAAPEPPADLKPGTYLDEDTLGWIGRSTEAYDSLPVCVNDIRRWAMGVIGSWSFLTSTSLALSPVWGGSPHKSSYRSTPRE